MTEPHGSPLASTSGQVDQRARYGRGRGQGHGGRTHHGMVQQPHGEGTCQKVNVVGLYLATADMILGAVKAQSAPSIMVICHNPGIAEFARMVVGSPPTHPDFRRYPTAATSVIEFDATTWSDVSWNTGKVIDFTVPKDFKD